MPEAAMESAATDARSLVSALTDLFEGGVQNVFASKSTHKSVGGGDGEPRGEGLSGGSRPHSLRQHRKASGKALPQAENGPDHGANKFSRIATSSSHMSGEVDLPDLPELRRLEPIKTMAMLIPEDSSLCGNLGLVESPRDGAPLSHKLSGAADSASGEREVGQTSGDANGKGDTTRGSITAARWTRTGGIPTSSASTLVPGMSPAITPAAEAGATFHEGESFGKTDGVKDDNGGGVGDTKKNVYTGRKAGVIPTPLDLSAIPPAAPPSASRPGTKSASSTSSVSNPVVLQVAALESLKRLGGPGSSVSNRSTRSNGSHYSRGGGMTAPLGSAISMEVPLGFAVPPGSASSSVGSNSLLSRRHQKRLESMGSAKEMRSMGSVVEEDNLGSEVGWRKTLTPSAGPERLPKSQSSASSREKGLTGGDAHADTAVRRISEEHDEEESDEHPPPPSPMLTGHLRPGPGPGPVSQDVQKQSQRQESQKQESKGTRQVAEQPQPAGRGRANKGRGSRPQTWNEEDLLMALGGSPVGRPVSTGRLGHRRGSSGSCSVGSGEKQQWRQLEQQENQQKQQKQKQQKQQQNQMRLVVRKAQAVVASGEPSVAQPVSPGALSIVSCSTAYSQSQGTRGHSASNSMDTGKHLDTLAVVAADIAKRGASPNAELVVGLGRRAFEQVSMSPSIPLHGNDLAGVSKAIPSSAVPAPPVGEVPSLEKSRAAAAAGRGGDPDKERPATSGSRRGRASRSRSNSSTGSGKPHVLETYSSRPGHSHDSVSSRSASGGYGSTGGDRSRMDAPSLTQAHAPGKVYRPVVVAGPTVGAASHQQKRGSGSVVARGTPATHSNGAHHSAHSREVDGDREAPFRLPSNMRLTSFGSFASSVVSPTAGAEGDRAKQQQPQEQEQQKQKQKQQEKQQQHQVVFPSSHSQPLGEDTSALARRPTTLDALSTFGSLNYSRADILSQVSDASDLSRSTVTDCSKRSSGIVVGSDTEKRHHSVNGVGGVSGHRPGARRSGDGGDRISQRRSRSNGSHGGGTRRFDVGGGYVTPERDARSHRRRNGSRSIGGDTRPRDESIESIKAKDSRTGTQGGLGGKGAITSQHNIPHGHAPVHSKDGLKNLGGDEVEQQQPKHKHKRRHSRSSSGRSRSRRGSRSRESSPAHSHSSRGSSRSKEVFSPARSSSSSKRRPKGSSGSNGTSNGVKKPQHHRRRSSGVISVASNASAKKAGDHARNRTAKDHPQESEETFSRHGLRQDGGKTVLAGLKEEAEACADGPAATAAATTDTASHPASVEYAAGQRKAEPLDDVINMSSPVPVSPAADGKGRGRRASRVTSNKTRTVKKRNTRLFFLLFRKKRGRSESCDSNGDDRRSVYSVAEGETVADRSASVNVFASDKRYLSFRRLARSDSRETANSGRRSPGKKRFAGWLWRKITWKNPQPSVPGGASPLRPAGDVARGMSVRSEMWNSSAAAAGSSTKGGRGKGRYKDAASGMSRVRMSGRLKSMSRSGGGNSTGQDHHTGRGHTSDLACYGSSGGAIGGCITQFYNSPLPEAEDQLEVSNRGDLAMAEIKKNLSVEEEAEEQARVQQLLRTSQVHMNKQSSMRSC